MGPPRKRVKTNGVAEVNFDFAAREEYLTGFHKRKQARIKHAQEQAAKREREERIRDRAELREQRKKDLEEHVAAVNAALKQARDSSNEESEADSDDGEEWNGFENPTPTINHEDEYVDEDKYTTVTVEEVDISRQGFVTHESDSESEKEPTTDGGESKEKPKDEEDDVKKKRVWTKEKPKTDRPKKKKQKFRYESKADRKLTRVKQKMKNREKAKARRGD